MSEQASRTEANRADERIFLVVVDESPEMRKALRYACRRAKRTGGRVAMLYVLDPPEGQQWGAVVDLMQSYAVALPLGVIGRLLGVPSDDRDRFRLHVEPLLTSTDPADSPGRLGAIAVAVVGNGTASVVLPVRAVARAWASTVPPDRSAAAGW